MRRWIAACFLVLLAFYAGAARFDPCDGSCEEHAQVCHVLCQDGCAAAPIPVAPVAPPPDPLPRPVYAMTTVRPVLGLEPEPEKAPPRA